MWLGTDVGVSRYDGVHFHNYDLTQVEPQAVKRICEMEQDSLLWLKLDRNLHMACFDKKTGLYIPLESDSETLLDDIHDLCIADSALYVLTSKGIERLDYRREDGRIVLTPSIVAEHGYRLVGLDCDPSRLYALDQGGNILIYNYRTGKKQVLDYDRLQTRRAVKLIRALNGYLWITTDWNGTYCYHPDTDRLRLLKSADGYLDNIQIKDIRMKTDSTFIAATPYAILRIAFQGTDYLNDAVKVEEVAFDNIMYNSFVRDRITKLYVDRKNSIIWLGTFGKGLMKVSFQTENIGRVLLEDEIGDINGVAQDARGYIWLTTKYHGVWKSEGTELSSDMKFARWNRFHADKYCCMFKDNNGGLWLADEDGTVHWLNPLTDQVLTFHPKYDGEHSIGSIWRIYLSIHNSLWLVSDKGLFVYDYWDDRCTAYMPYNETVQKITSLCEDGDGLMWLGTNDGVRKAQPDGNKIVLSYGREEEIGVTRNEVLDIYVNRYNELYISYADKLLQTDGQRERAVDVKILQKDMMSGHAECIIDDKSGNTWMGNNMGIMAVNNKTKASYTYSLPERLYNVCQLNDGRLLWTSSNGLLYFDPRTLKQISLPEQLYISDIGINYNKVEIGEEIGGQVILKKPIYQMNELVLDNANNSVIFYLTDLNFKEMASKIKYRLLPIQPEWITSYRSDIEYSDLAPGEYQLEVCPVSINEDEVETTRLKIVVKKHWASSNWAILCYALAATLFALLAWYYVKSKASRRLFYRKKEELLKNSLAEEIKERKQETIIHNLRSQARSSLVRELRTPLSLITAPLKEMITAPTLPAILAPKAKTAYRNVIAMQDVCDLMLNIYSLEGEELHLNVACYPVSELLNSAISSSNELLNVAPIKLHYDKNSRVKKEVWVDRKKMEYILRNILSNAYRHISYSGNVYVTLSTETFEGRECCCIRIKDDGKSIVRKNAVYQLSKEEGGQELTSQIQAELGIILMKEHITAHHGDILIEQDTESGSNVSVYIPLGKEHFNEDTRVTFVEPEERKAESSKPADIITAEEKEQQMEEEENLSLLTPPATGGKYKILVIEDHKDIRLYLKVLFGSTYNVIMAENGEEGVKMARREMPDIILSDVMMPVMNGFECTRILKEDLKTCHIPIIILTALVGDADAVKGIELGADDYILKPFNPDILRSKVKRLIKNRVDLKQAYMKLMMSSTASSETDGEQEAEGQKEDPFIRQIFEIVEKNLQNPDFNVKRLAEMVNMSQPTLYRRVKMLTNYTIIELIRGVRLKHAAELLRTKKYSIQEVSEMVGYNDAPTFRKHFVDFYGTTPSTFCNKESAEEKKISG